MPRFLIALAITSCFSCIVLQANTEPPRVYLTEFISGNQSLSVDSLLKEDRITLDYGMSGFSLSYTSNNSFQNEQLVYYYQLAGLDKHWIQGNSMQKAQYNFLPAGNYVFRVKAINDYGLSSPEASFKIYIRPPFWKTPWFIALLVLAALTLVYLVSRSLDCRLKKVQLMRNRIAENLHNEISNALSSVNVLGEMVRMKMNTDPEVIEQYIFKISESNTQAMEAMDDILWSIDPQNDSMAKVAEQMKKMTKSLLFAQNISYNFTITAKALQAGIDMQTRHDLLILYKMLIKNIAAYSECYHVKIELGKAAQNMQLMIEDDGKTFNEEEMNRLPVMAEIRRRIELLHGTITFHQLSRGTRILITMGIKHLKTAKASQRNFEF